MDWHRHPIAAILICLACVGHGWGVQTSSDRLQDSTAVGSYQPIRELDATLGSEPLVGGGNSLEALVRLLQFLDPANAFNPTGAASGLPMLMPGLSSSRRTCSDRRLCHGHRTSVIRMATAIDEAEDRLSSEFKKPAESGDRSMETIMGMVDVLETDPLPQRLKRTLLGDWQLMFLNEDDILKKLQVEDTTSIFKDSEEIFLRITSDDVRGNMIQTIEIVKGRGIFAKNFGGTFVGLWELDQDEQLGKQNKAYLEWENEYKLDAESREVNMDDKSIDESKKIYKLRVSYASEEFLVVHLAENDKAIAVFRKTRAMFEWIEKYFVDPNTCVLRGLFPTQ